VAEPVDLRGVIDPRIGIAHFIERDRPAFVRRSEERLADRATNGGPGLHRDLIKAAVWGVALAGLIRVASRFRVR
jgi:hypothetical protein